MRRLSETVRLGSLAALVFALGGAPSSAWASAESAFVSSLDRPTATKIVRPKSGSDAVGQITCTYYADIMVRETGTDSPDPDNATLVVLSKGGARPSCSAADLAGGMALKTEGYALEGRKGGFLIWDASDPNGAEDFLVLSATSGALLFEDGLSPSLGLHRSATLESGLLHMKYTRGYNAPCSIAQNAQGCWSQIVTAGGAPSGMPALTQAPASCLAAYKHTQIEDPSVVTYTVDMTLDSTGKTAVMSDGVVSCQPQP